MKLRHPGLIRLAALAGAGVVRAWMATVRFRAAFAEGCHPADPRRQRFVYAFWHESLLFPAVQRADIRVLIS